MSRRKLTPMFEQYLRIKEEHPDALLFYRMGDFFELFFEDAEIAARELSIALTTRNPNAEVKVPMCGVPHHAAEGYLAQLMAKGYKVAVCDQIQDPKEAKGLVERAVTRVLTPGTVVEDANLAAKEPNYLAALIFDADKGSGGLAWADASTGEFGGLHTRQETELWQWVVKLEPRELLLAGDFEIPSQYRDLSDQVTRLPLGLFDPARAGRDLLASQGLETLATIDLDDKPELVRACGAVLAYLRQTQKLDEVQLDEFRLVILTRHLIIDEITERNLELFRRLDGRTGPGTLWKVLDRTLTPMGGRLLAERLKRPWRDPGPIRSCQDNVEWFVGQDRLRGKLRTVLDLVYDLERLSTRIFLGRAAPKDFTALRNTLAALPQLPSLFEGLSPPKELAALLANWDGLDDLSDLLGRALADPPPPTVTEGGLFRYGFDPRLDELIELTEHGESTLAALLKEERERSGIAKLKLGFNKVFGYYLEVSKAHQGEIPEDFIRRQTLVNSERYITPRLKEMEERILSASEERKTLEYKMFQDMRQTVARARPRLLFMAHAVAGLDYWQCLAETARVLEWTRPELHTGPELVIEQGRHPVVEAAQGGNYVPNSLTMDENRRILLITGPNMAGKSTVLRQAAILTILAQMGSFVPARQARIGLADRVFSRVGASDNLAQGQSTFMVEMMETARILRLATAKSLVILDEIGRGTSTFDGLALAWAVVEELSRRGKGGIRTLFATHYHELTALEGRIPGLRNLNIAVKEWKGDIVFLRRLVPGPADKSYGIEVARLAGVPRPVVDRAREILANLEEKALNSRQATARASQTLLPGLTPQPSPSPEAPPEHPLARRIRELDVDAMTPLEALALLHAIKRDTADPGNPGQAKDDPS